MLRIRDTTLREGLQIPGMHLNLSEKKYIIKLLYQAGIREIEIGFPNDIESCKEIALHIKKNYKMKTSGIVQINRDNFKTIIKQSKGVLDVIDITMPRLDQKNFKLYIKRLNEAIMLAKKLKINYGIAIMNSTETDIKILKKIAKYEGDKLMYYDSKGIANPLELYSCLKKIKHSSLFFHGHNDYGTALANGLSAIKAGVKGIDASILGMGARAGNISLEELSFVLEKQFKKSVLDIKILQKLIKFFKKKKKFSKDLISPFNGDLIFTETSVAHMINPNAFRPYSAKIKYAFSLPVSYKEFIETIGKYNQKIELELRKATKKTGNPYQKGLSKKEVINIINKYSK